MTALERTVIDCIHLFEKIGGLEKLLRCVDLIPALDEAALAECLAEYGSGFLYQKAGYLFSPFAASQPGRVSDHLKKLEKHPVS